MAALEDAKLEQQRNWSGVAEGWGRWLAWTERNFSPVTDWLHEAARPGPGSRILDVACGAGFPALEIARRTGAARIVACDISPRMLAVASRCARQAGVRNVTFVHADAEALAYVDEAFDLITCVYGLMFCPAPARALAEYRRVLKPGGTAALVVWDQPSANPFFTVMLRTIARTLALPKPGPDAPTGFRFAPAGALESVLREAGFAAATVERVAMTIVCESLEEYWSAFLDLSVGLRETLAALPADDAARLRSAVADAAAPFVDRGRLALAANSLCALAKK